MTNYRAIRPRFRWGATAAGLTLPYELLAGYPLGNAMAWSDPRQGSVAILSPSGSEDAWITGRDYFLQGDLSYVPRDRTTNPYATGWNDTTDGVQEWLYWMRQKNVPYFYPDGRNVLDSPTMTVDTNADGLVDDFTKESVTGLTTYTCSVDSGAQKIAVANNSSGVTKTPGVVQWIPVKPGDVLTLTGEAWITGIVNGVSAAIYLEPFDVVGGSIQSGTVLVAVTAAVSGTRIATAAMTQPSTATVVKVFVALTVPNGATSAANLWVRNLVAQRGPTAGAAFIDNPRKTVTLIDPFQGMPALEQDRTRRLTVKLRATDAAAFLGY